MTSHDNVTDIVEQKTNWNTALWQASYTLKMYQSEVTDEVLNGAIGKSAKNAKDAAKTICTLLDDLATLRKQLENAREVIIEANNSLYGSQGYFLSLDGGPPNKYHLAEGIEKLKSNARELPEGQRDEVR